MIFNLNLRHGVFAAILMAAGINAHADRPGEATLPQTTAEADSVEMMTVEEAARAYPAPKAENADSVKEKPLTAADLFVSAPASVFPTIDPLTRMDMIDYFHAGSGKPSKNLVGGECRITEESPEKLTVKTSDVSEYTLAVLPQSSGKGKIIMLSRTLKTPVEDSTVTFYTTDWKEIKGLFTVPTLEEWMLPEGKKNRKDVENAVPFVLAKLEYFPDRQAMTLTNNLPEYIPEESLGIAGASLHKSLTYKWNGKRFVMEK